MSHLLAIETATNVCSVAVARDDHILADFTMNRPRKHAEQLALISKDALRASGLDTTDLDAVAVSMGPGSYTGLRIGVSSAKALAMAASAKLIGVPTLEGMASSVCSFGRPGDLVMALLDARRDEVYAWLGSLSEERTLAEKASTRACRVDDLPAMLHQHTSTTCWIVGNGTKKSLAVLQQEGGVPISTPSESHPTMAARWVALRGLNRIQAGDFEDIAAFEPYYLKEFQTNRTASSVFDKLAS